LATNAEGIAAERLSGWILIKTIEYRMVVAAARAAITPMVI
jgi:hypothetical protein